MRQRLSACVLALAALAPALHSQAPTKNPQRLAFLGDPDSPRTRAFAAFLGEHFADVATFARDTADLQAVRKADVVLLDWPQGEAARAQRQAGWSPLGARGAWDKPTVLLGSAGLNLAGAWQVRGGFG